MLNKIYERLSNNPVKSIVVILVMIVVLVIGVTKISMATGNDTLVQPTTDVYQDNGQLEEEFGGESIIVLYESDDLLTPAHLEHMKGIEQTLERTDAIYSIISPVMLVEEMAEQQFAAFKEELSDIVSPGLPTKQQTLDKMIYEEGQLRPMFEEVVPDERHMVMLIKFKGATTDTEKSDVIQLINHYLDAEPLTNAETIVSGKPVLDNSIRSSMQESIKKMMGLALLIMVVVLFFVFKVRWRLLPLFTVLLAVIGTVGLMGWADIPITTVSMAVFPILIGLGIDYAIQFQNRYAEEMERGGSHD